MPCVPRLQASTALMPTMLLMRGDSPGTTYDPKLTEGRSVFMMKLGMRLPAFGLIARSALPMLMLGSENAMEGGGFQPDATAGTEGLVLKLKPRLPEYPPKIPVAEPENAVPLFVLVRDKVSMTIALETMVARPVICSQQHTCGCMFHSKQAHLSYHEGGRVMASAI